MQNSQNDSKKVTLDDGASRRLRFSRVPLEEKAITSSLESKGQSRLKELALCIAETAERFEKSDEYQGFNNALDAIVGFNKITSNDNISLSETAFKGCCKAHIDNIEKSAEKLRVKMREIFNETGFAKFVQVSSCEKDVDNLIESSPYLKNRYNYLGRIIDKLLQVQNKLFLNDLLNRELY